MMGASPPTFLHRPPGEVPAAIADGFARAVAEAWRFAGATAPNPPVGCTILDKAGRVLGCAAHERAGTAHAEAAALARLRETRREAEAATLLVTLEPCNHQGRTGPCTEAILASPIREVWIGQPDPNPHVAGGGAARLRAAGLAVHALEEGRTPAAMALAAQCGALIAPFTRRMTAGRPWITVKQALDEAGSMRPPEGRTTFTSPDSLRLAHRLRRATDAIVTGTGTILADRPLFTVRHVPDHPERARLLVVVGQPHRLPAAYVEEAQDRGFRVRQVDELAALPGCLAAEGVLWAMVEGGPRLLQSLRAASLWDDWLTIRRPREPGAPDEIAVVQAQAGPSPLLLLPDMPASAFNRSVA